MIDRCAGCGWPLTQLLCCPEGGGAYWSKHAPAPQDAWWPLLEVNGFYLYGAKHDAPPPWSPLTIEPPGYHPGYPPFVMRVYRGYINKARRARGQRSLLHYRQFIQTYWWAKRSCSDHCARFTPGAKRNEWFRDPHLTAPTMKYPLR